MAAANSTSRSSCFPVCVVNLPTTWLPRRLLRFESKMSRHGLRKRSAKPCYRYAEESLAVVSLRSRKQKPPNSLLITNGVSLLQTKLSDREGYEARRIGLEAMPLDQHIEGRHGEREPGLKIGPAPMHHLFEMADKRQHGEHGLHQHAVLPLAALTQFEVGRIPLGGMEGGIAQDD